MLFPENEQTNYQNIAENGNFQLEEVTSQKSEENCFGDSTVKEVALEKSSENSIGFRL
ncbi:MAG: hypothetical protein F6K40_33355 [Okeania sp. SIO3I5]|uniref:hypothetical protein n=1 Tax=Okeania sp. SIO3I5 TaxID=2607805 RepID=UPI0013B66D92|nr:hypothetical protein [Okeania sp. SIO3I5]NEQ40845.1 hypothetical protein [Okeania sp. SIO3I5]NEQ40846.1 hypothetical protein [Okeania sp. SIO3I5]